MSSGKKVAVIMGSDSDFAIVSAAIKRLKAYEAPTEVHVTSAHRTPSMAAEFAKNARANGFDVIIAAAGKAAHLAGVLVVHATLPVIGISIKCSILGGLDAPLATVQMSGGIPVATVVINGVDNVTLLAIQIFSFTDEALADQLEQMKQKMTDEVEKKDEAIQSVVKALQASNGGKGMKSLSESYKAAGVDVTAGYRAVELIKNHVARTTTPGALPGLGGFGGLLCPDLSGMKEPVLVSGTDGVGTRLRLAFLMDQHDTIGINCVAMCANDAVRDGTQSLFFLDYLAVGKNHPEKIEKIVAGVAEGCVQSGCASVGGETVEMPGSYPEDEYDLAGFYVGMADRSKIIDGSQMQPGDVILDLGSSGVHSNGFSLVCKVLRLDSGNVDRHADELDKMLDEELLTPTRIYAKSVLNLMKQCNVKTVPHITSGGLYENVPRMMKGGLTVKLEKAALSSLPTFHLLQSVGNIPEHDMCNTFNMGIGMCLVVSPEETDKAAALLREMGERVFVIGQVGQGTEDVVLC